MKKNYFLTLILTLCFGVISYGQDLIITGVFDGPNSGGTPKGMELYVVNNIADLSIYAIGSANNGGGSDGEEFTFPADAATAGTYIYIASETTQFTAFFGFAPTYNGGSAVGINGDDAMELFQNGTVIDTFGDIDTDGTGETWDYLDGWAYRKDGTGPEGTTFTVSNWNYSGTNQLEGASTNAGTNSPFPLGTYSPTASADPSIAINAPLNNAVFPSTTTEVPVTLTVENFTLSGDNGSGMTDGSGDGYIKATLDETGQPQEITSFFTTTPTPITVVAGRSYTATVELVDNAGASLTPQVMATVSFSVELPCDLTLGSIATTCDASTAALDTFSGTIDFTGGNTGITYTITAPAGVVVGGDDPNTMAAGTITFSNMTEGTNYDIDIVGGAGSSCDYDRTLFSPTCFPLPFYEPFDYTADTDLISHPLWQDASTSGTPNNIQVKANDNGGGGPVLGNFYLSTEFPDQMGNMVSMSGSGSDPYIGFDEQTTGTVYASFNFHVTDFTGVGDDDGGYFAILAENGSFRGRVWVRDVTADTTEEGLQFNVGISTGSGSSGTYHTTFTANLAEPVFVVMGYDLDNDELDLWVVPDATSFGTNTPPAPNVTLTDATATGINRFLLRQDSSNETPAMNFDELRVGTSWSDVAPSPATASNRDETIEGFATYPNPVENKRFTITTNSISEKKVQIYNVLGRQVFATQFSSNDKLIDISTLSNGIYILKVQEGSKVATKKLVVR